MVDECHGLELLINQMDASGATEVAAALRASHAECKAKPQVEPEGKHPELPPLWIRGLNFAKALTAHVADGMRRCEQSEIEERLKICEGCDKFADNHCTLCGCSCVEANQLVNKLAWKSSECPLQKWEKL